MRSLVVAGAGLVLGLLPPATAGQLAPGRQAAAPTLPMYTCTVVRSYPHDPDAFTQGLQYLGGVIYEGTGLNGRSSIRRVVLASGEVQLRRDLGREHFGEGITVFKDRLIQLTWQSGLAFVYDAASFKPLRQFTYRGEGWGLTHDGVQLIMSDGTDELRFLDPATFKEQRRLKVTAVGEPVPRLNELEYMKGEVLANVWQTDYIARINPKTGVIAGWIDARGLLTPRERASTDVLNGIAYDEAGDRLFITGKLWPRIFEVTLRRADAPPPRTP